MSQPKINSSMNNVLPGLYPEDPIPGDDPIANKERPAKEALLEGPWDPQWRKEDLQNELARRGVDYAGLNKLQLLARLTISDICHVAESAIDPTRLLLFEKRAAYLWNQSKSEVQRSLIKCNGVRSSSVKKGLISELIQAEERLGYNKTPLEYSANDQLSAGVDSAPWKSASGYSAQMVPCQASSDANHYTAPAQLWSQQDVASRNTKPKRSTQGFSNAFRFESSNQEISVPISHVEKRERVGSLDLADICSATTESVEEGQAPQDGSWWLSERELLERKRLAADKRLAELIDEVNRANNSSGALVHESPVLSGTQFSPWHGFGPKEDHFLVTQENIAPLARASPAQTGKVHLTSNFSTSRTMSFSADTCDEEGDNGITLEHEPLTLQSSGKAKSFSQTQSLHPVASKPLVGPTWLQGTPSFESRYESLNTNITASPLPFSVRQSTGGHSNISNIDAWDHEYTGESDAFVASVMPGPSKNADSRKTSESIIRISALKDDFEEAFRRLALSRAGLRATREAHDSAQDAFRASHNDMLASMDRLYAKFEQWSLYLHADLSEKVKHQLL
jgi:hypothetical protein